MAKKYLVARCVADFLGEARQLPPPQLSHIYSQKKFAQLKNFDFLLEDEATIEAPNAVPTGSSYAKLVIRSPETHFGSNVNAARSTGGTDYLNMPKELRSSRSSVDSFDAKLVCSVHCKDRSWSIDYCCIECEHVAVAIAARATP